mgnify:CR=1 FL=1
MPRKGFRIGERVWLIREMLSVPDHKTGYKKKRKEHRKHLPIPEQQSVCGTCGNGFRGKKASEGKVRSEKTQTDFFVFIVHTCRILLQ